MSIDPTRPIPVYFQLKTLLLEEVLSGRYGPGDRLPTEQELCEEHAISRTPVSRALSELADEGVIVRYRRRGSFVSPHWTPPDPQAAELRIAVVEEGPWRRLIERAAAAVDADVSIVTVPFTDLHTVLTRAIAEGRAPDLAVIDSVWVPEFAAAGFLWDLERLAPTWVAQQYLDDFLEPLASANRYEGGLYAVHAEVDVAGLWYAREALGGVAARPPATWDELREALRRAGDAGWREPLALPGGSRAGETTTFCLLGLLASNGVSVLDHHGVTLDTAAAVEALRFLRSLVEAGLVSPDAVGYEWNRSIKLLAGGQAAFSVGGSYEARLLMEESGRELAELWERFGFMPFPAGPRGHSATLAGGMVYGIFRQSSHPKEAMRLLEQVTSPTALAEMATATGHIPPRNSAVDLLADREPFVTATAAMLDHAVVRPQVPTYPRVSAQLQVMLEAVLTGRLGPATATERTAEMISAITGRPVLHAR